MSNSQCTDHYGTLKDGKCKCVNGAKKNPTTYLCECNTDNNFDIDQTNKTCKCKDKYSLSIDGKTCVDKCGAYQTVQGG